MLTIVSRLSLISLIAFSIGLLINSTSLTRANFLIYSFASSGKLAKTYAFLISLAPVKALILLRDTIASMIKSKSAGFLTSIVLG